MSSQFLLRRVEQLEKVMVPPNAGQRSKIVVQFIEPNPDGDGSPGKVVGELEVLVDMPSAQFFARKVAG